MVPESMKPKKTKDFSNPMHRHSMDVSSTWGQDKFEGYPSHYEPKYGQNYRYKQKKSYNDLNLMINSKPFTIGNYESMDRKLFFMKLADYISKLRLDEETYLITKIYILNELSKQKSRHFDLKEYEELLARLADHTEGS